MGTVFYVDYKYGHCQEKAAITIYHKRGDKRESEGGSRENGGGARHR